MYHGCKTMSTEIGDDDVSSICFRRDCDHDTTTMVAVPPNRICRHLKMIISKSGELA